MGAIGDGMAVQKDDDVLSDGSLVIQDVVTKVRVLSEHRIEHLVDRGPGGLTTPRLNMTLQDVGKNRGCHDWRRLAGQCGRILEA